MKNSYLIWIPSIQKNLRFYEITWDQLRTILKVIDDNEIEFIYQLNTILKENLIGDFDINRFTTLDRFVIFLYLKIYSCGPKLSLSAECSNDKCKQTINRQIDLGTIGQILGQRVDRSFIYPVKVGPYSLKCDIPTISNEYKIYEHNLNNNTDRNSLEERINNYVISHVTELSVEGINIFTEDRDYAERVLILNNLPYEILKIVEKRFIKQIHNLISDLSFIEFKCNKCKKEMPFNFSFANINDFLKIIFKDHSITSVLVDHLHLTEKLHMNSEFISRISPSEIDVFIKFLKQTEETERQQQQQSGPPPRDLFEENYRSQSAGMQESRSEFS